MKRLILTAALALAPTLALADDLSGTWRVHLNSRGHELTVDCHFAQHDKSLGGSCSRADGEDKPIPLQGTLTGLNARWTYTGMIDGRRERIAFNGNVEGTTISGTADVDGVAATFEATKQ